MQNLIYTLGAIGLIVAVIVFFISTFMILKVALSGEWKSYYDKKRLKKIDKIAKEVLKEQIKGISEWDEIHPNELAKECYDIAYEMINVSDARKEIHPASINKDKKIGLNNFITVYPNDKGLEKMKSIIDGYKLVKLDASDYIKSHMTKDGGFRLELHDMMSTFGEMFFMGNNYFEKLEIVID